MRKILLKQKKFNDHSVKDQTNSIIHNVKGKAGSILVSPGGENWCNSLILICGDYFSFDSVLITVFTYNQEF